MSKRSSHRRAATNTQEDNPRQTGPVTQLLALPLRVLRVPLFGNAFFLMLNTGMSAALGAGFWLVAARYYPESEVGLAAALIPLASFLAGAATLGLGIGLIRFLPERLTSPHQARQVVNTSLTLSGLLAIVLTLAFLSGVEWWTPRLAFLRENLLVAIAFALLSGLIAVRTIQTHVFVALRQVQYAFASSLVSGVRVPLPILLVGVGGSMGLVAAYGIGALVAVGISALIFLPWLLAGYRPLPSARFDLLRPMFGFSLGNHTAILIGALLPALLPIMVVELRSPQENAWFYIAWFLGSILHAIPGSLSTSLLAEGSQLEVNLVRDFRRTVVGSATLLAPSAVFLWFAGDWLLGIFGPGYATGGFGLLRWLVLASPFVLLNQVYFTMVRIAKQVFPLIAGVGFITFVTLGLSFVLLPQSGLEVIGISYLASQALFSAGAGLDALRGRWRRVMATNGTDNP